MQQGRKPVLLPPNQYGNGVNVGNLSTTYTEYSGLASANRRENYGYLWAIEDGATAYVIAINARTGAAAGQWTLSGIGAPSDTEDLSSAIVNGVPYIYHADTGDNANARATIIITRAVEPIITGSNGTIAAGDIHQITCQFPGANIPSHKDLECIIVDPLTGDIYFITKRITPVLCYRLPHQQVYSGTQTLEYMGQLTADATFNTLSTTRSGNNGYVTGGSIHPKGTEIVLRSYRSLYHFPRNPLTQTVIAALQQTPSLIGGYVGGGLASPIATHPSGEPQGEALTHQRELDGDARSIFTCSEYLATDGSTASAYPLYRYDRIDWQKVTEVSFQTGVSPTAGYAGTTDTYIDSGAAGSDFSAAASLVCDYDWTSFPTTPSRTRAALLKFDLSSIPAGARIVRAALRLYINTEGLGMRLFRMLTSWSGTSTWTSLSGGVSLDDVEAKSTADAYLLTPVGSGLDTYVGYVELQVPVATIQDWVNNASVNHGWYITGPLESTGDGVQIDSAEGVTANRRPELKLAYI